VRFYDLARDPILCPACGVVHTPVIVPVIDITSSAAQTFGKTGWRRKTFARPEAAVPAAQAEAAAAPELAAVGDDDADAAKAVEPEDEIVLEPDEDDADASDLVDLDVEDPKES
jgi:hypothetical protein